MGWAMGIERLFAQPGRAAEGLAVARAMQRTVDEIGSVAEHEGIDCHFVKGGTINIATRPFDALDMQTEAAHRREQGSMHPTLSGLTRRRQRRGLICLPIMEPCIHRIVPVSIPRDLPRAWPECCAPKA
jgi:hypothetical protein